MISMRKNDQVAPKKIRKPKTAPLPISIVLAIIFFATAVFFIYQYYQLARSYGEIAPPQEPASTPTPTPNPPFSEKTINIGGYQITLPVGWRSQPVQTYPNDRYNRCPFNINEPSCQDAHVQQMSNENNTYRISDVIQNPLVGGGWAPRVDEEISLGPTGYRTGFRFFWNGYYKKDEHHPEAGFARRLDEDGKPDLWTAGGCLKKDLCIYFNPEERYSTSLPYATNWQNAEEFKKFVNSLKIEKLPSATPTSQKLVTNEGELSDNSPEMATLKFFKGYTECLQQKTCSPVDYLSDSQYGSEKLRQNVNKKYEEMIKKCDDPCFPPDFVTGAQELPAQVVVGKAQISNGTARVNVQLWTSRENGLAVDLELKNKVWKITDTYP